MNINSRICTQCGALLPTKDEKGFIICEFCGTSYLTNLKKQDNELEYTGEAYFRFKNFQLTATRGVLTMNIVKLIFESDDGGFQLDVQNIKSISTTENINYAGEIIGRVIPNCIKVVYTDIKDGKEKKIDIRIHKAPVVAETLNKILEQQKRREIL